MRLPRISTRSIPAILAIVAADCLVYRSFSARPPSISIEMSQLTLAMVGMTNLLAVLLALVVLEGVRTRRFSLGFVVGGLVGLGATFVGFSTAMSALESTLEPTPFGQWLMASPIRQAVGYFGVVVVLPFLFQVSLGLTGGWIARKVIWTTTNDVLPASGRRWLVAATSLVILLALPCLAVEATFQWKIEPPIARRASGIEGVVDFHGFGAILPKRSKLRGLEGIKVRVDRDDEVPVIEFQATSVGGKIVNDPVVRDFRRVWVTLKDGDRAGETLGIPYCFLTPLP